MPSRRRLPLWLFAFAVLLAPPVRAVQPAAIPQLSASDVPFVPTLTFVLAVHAPEPAAAGSRIAQGDYEMVVAIAGIDAGDLTLATLIEAQDERKQPILALIQRRLPAADLANARMQILGFHTNDSPTLAGTSSLGPSLAVMRDLRTTGRAAYSVRNFNHLSTSTGTLIRASESAVQFPVLFNGKRVTLPAMRVTGQLKYGENIRPWEFLLLDHPSHPLTLRFAVGAVGSGFPLKEETTREIVRIDLPSLRPKLGVALAKDCRVEVPGIYFEFNRATINPQSAAALKEIAETIRSQPAWNLTIEGHTDNVGSDAYNDDLSARRAAAVKEALVRDHGVAAARLTTAGFGERRPKETNETIQGRARNRRVELVRECGK